jgi:NAD-dependent dihydropyrimidine dehydrogenase PreA subunit
MATTRKIVTIDEELCDGCGNCVIDCAEGALEIRDGKARLIAESYCDGLGACISGCPKGAVKVIEREAGEFDPEAVEKYLDQKKFARQEESSGTVCSCPSARIETFAPVFAKKPDHEESDIDETELSHWPIQIRLIPPNAPFLKGADLLVVSDCAPVAYPNFHRKFVGGKAVLLGCPKFDNLQEYERKFAEIFRVAGIRSVTVVDMEVPCCSALPAVVRRGALAAGVDIPLREIVISVRGKVLKQGKDAA